MGISNAGPVGNWRKKVGNVVARVSQGRTILSIYQPEVSNPRTQAQQSQRNKLTLCSEFGGKVADVLKVGFKNVVKVGTAYAYAVGKWMKEAISGVYPSATLDLGLVTLSQGSLSNPYNLACQAAGTDFTINWTDNSDTGNALASDQCVVCAYNGNKKEAISDFATATRSDHNATISVSSAWTGDDVMIWCFFKRPDGSLVSDSRYLGKFTV